MDDIYNEVTQKLAQFDENLNSIKTDCDNKTNIDDVNAMLDNKANKPTVAQALHRKANKGEVDDLLAQKVSMDDFNRLLNKLNEKANIAELHHLKSEIEAKTDRTELQEILQTHSSGRKDSGDRSLFNNLAKEREL